MKKEMCNCKKTAVVIQAVFIYIWLTVLSALSGTDTYYSVYLLCGAAGFFCLLDNYKAGRSCCRREWVTLTVFAALFSLAVVLANYPLFEPLTVLQNLLNLGCCLAGGFFAAYGVLLYLLKRLPYETAKTETRHPGRVFLLVFGMISGINLLYLLFAHYPGTLTIDSISTMEQLLGNSPYDNVMPFWHTVTVELFVKLGLRLFGDINAAVALFHGAQILFMAACFGFAVMTLYQAGIPAWFLWGIGFIYGGMPYNIVYSVTLWKDIPFAGAALLFLTALYRLMKGIGKKRLWNEAIFVLGAMGFSLWRTNGWYAFLATVLVMALLLRKKQKRLLILMVVVLIFCWVLINPVLELLGVGGTNFVEAFAVPMQQIARVVSEGRPLTAEETAFLGEVFWLDKLGQLYNPQTVDPVKFETFLYHKVDYIKEHAGDYVRLYLSLGMRYPGDYLKAWIEETKGYWNGGYFFWIYSREVVENSYGITLTLGDNLIAKLFGAAFRYLEKPEFLQPLTSIGLHVWALIGCCVVNCLRKREELLLTIPLLVLVVGLWLGTPVFSEFRYAYPVFLGMPLILAVTLFGGEKTEKSASAEKTESGLCV